MELSIYFKSIIDQDHASVVICNLQHEIIYMNPAAIANYKNYGGASLLGKSLMNCHNEKSKIFFLTAHCFFHIFRVNCPVKPFLCEKLIMSAML